MSRHAVWVRVYLQPGPNTALISERQYEVLRCVALGDSNDEIAARLFVTADTVKTHVRRLLSVLGAKNRTHAVSLAFKYGILAYKQELPPSRRAFESGSMASPGRRGEPVPPAA
jgi:DNA-binding CsgD family transcriptional regulator